MRTPEGTSLKRQGREGGAREESGLQWGQRDGTVGCQEVRRDQSPRWERWANNV